MRFFTDCKTQEEAKAIYRKWAKVLHPDKGGDPDLMAKLKGQYDDYKSGKHVKEQFKQAFSQRTSDIPFDHPIHSQLRQLQIDKAELTSQINKLKLQFEWHHSRIKAQDEKIDALLDDINSATLEKQSLKHRLAQTQIERDNALLQELPVWQRYLFYASYIVAIIIILERLFV